jgi:hypothetical protein
MACRTVAPDFAALNPGYEFNAAETPTPAGE